MKIFLAALLISSFAHALPATLNFQARIRIQDGQVLENTDVNFFFEYTSPDGACVLYQEAYDHQNMYGSGGLVSFQLGVGVDNPTTGYRQIFSSAAGLKETFKNGGTYTCKDGSTYTPGINDIRKLAVKFAYTGSGGWNEVAGIKINSVPFAMYATEAQNSDSLGGVAAALYTKFADFTTCTGGQVLTYNGSTFSCVTPGSSTNFSGVLAGDVSGTQSATVVDTVGGKTAAQISTSVDDTLNATNSATASRLVKRDGSGNASFNTAQANNFSGRNLLLFEATDTNKVTVVAPSTFTAGDYTLTLPQNSGSTGYVLSTDGNGVTSWVSPATGNVTSVGASAPLVSTGGQTPNISIPAATASVDGYLSAVDFTIFNSKVSSQWITTGNDIYYNTGKVGVGTGAAIIAPLSIAANNATTNTGGIPFPTSYGGFYLSNNIDSTLAIRTLGSGHSQIATDAPGRYLSFATAEFQERMRIDASGRVGIGLTNPVHKLDVVGDVNVTGNFKINGVDIASGTVTNVGATAPLLSSGGTTPTISMPAATAAVDGYLSAADFTTFNNKVSSQWSNNATDIYFNTGNVGIGTSAPVNKLDVFGGMTIGSGWGIVTAPADGLAVQGNIGIGVNAPKGRLDVNGGIVIGSGFAGVVTPPADGITVKGDIGVGVNAPKGKVDIAGNAVIGANWAGVHTPPANGLLVQGNVGIGTTTPNTTLEVKGSTATDGVVRITTDAATTDAGVQRLELGTTISGTYTPTAIIGDTSGGDSNLKIFALQGDLQLGANTGGAATTRVWIKNDGNVGIGASPGAEKLLVRGVSSPSSVPAIHVDAGGAAHLYMGVNDTTPGSEYAWIQSHGSRPLRINELGNDTIINASSGAVGIGTATPLFKLDVNGDINVSGNFKVNGVNIATGGGTVTSVSSANTDIAVSMTSPTPVLTLNAGTTGGGGDANKIVKLDGSGKIAAAMLPSSVLDSSSAFAGDVTGTAGSNTVEKIRGTNVAITSLTSGNFMKYDGTNWVNSTPAIADVTGLSTALGNKLDVSNMPASCGASQTLTFSSPSGAWTCSSIAGLDAGVITTGTIDAARLPASANFWQDAGSGIITYTGGDVMLANMRALRWGANTDGASIRFESTSDAVGGSKLIIETIDNEDEEIVFRQFGLDRMIVGTNGYVGIGTSTPGTPLSVVGKGSATEASSIATFAGDVGDPATSIYGMSVGKKGTDHILMGLNKNTDTGGVPALSNFISTWQPASGLSLGRGGGNGLPNTSDLYINGMGNIGLGTVAPQTKFEVRAPHMGPLTDVTQTTSNAGILINSDLVDAAHGPGVFWTTNDNAGKPKAGMWMYQENGPGSWLMFGTSNAYATGITNNAMAISPTGKVGVGTSNPGEKFEVNGSIGVGSDSISDTATYGSQIRFLGANSDDQWIARYNETPNTTDLRVNLGDDTVGVGTDKFSIGATISNVYHTAMTVLSNGTVGIGTRTPAAALDVVGQIRPSMGTPLVNPAGNNVDFATGNTQYVTISSCPGDATTVNLYSMLEGGSYSLIITSPANCLVDFTGISHPIGGSGGVTVTSFKYPAGQKFSSTGNPVVYSFLRANNFVFVAQVVDFQ